MVELNQTRLPIVCVSQIKWNEQKQKKKKQFHWSLVCFWFKSSNFSVFSIQQRKTGSFNIKFFLCSVHFHFSFIFSFLLFNNNILDYRHFFSGEKSGKIIIKMHLSAEYDAVNKVKWLRNDEKRQNTNYL